MNPEDFSLFIEKNPHIIKLLPEVNSMGETSRPIVERYFSELKKGKLEANLFLEGIIFSMLLGLCDTTDEALGLNQKIRENIIKLDKEIVK